jgi:hypothetical protein
MIDISEMDASECEKVYCQENESHENFMNAGMQMHESRVEWTREILIDELKPRGRYFVGGCPFHNEQTPSLIYEPMYDEFNCLSCGMKGNGYELAQAYANQGE